MKSQNLAVKIDLAPFERELDTNQTTSDIVINTNEASMAEEDRIDENAPEDEDILNVKPLSSSNLESEHLQPNSDKF